MYSRRVWAGFGMFLATQITPHWSCAKPVEPEIGTPVTIERCVEQPTEVTDETGCYRPVAPLALIGRCQTVSGGELIQDGSRFVCEH